MKLLATGDWHLGAGSDYGPRPGDRLTDQEHVVQRIAELAAEENVDCVLHAGDVFERRSPSPAELIVWRGFVDRLHASGIPLLVISGNHDVAHADLPTAAEVVHPCRRLPEVTHQFGVSVGVLPWTPPARLVAAEGGGDRDAIHERAAELLLESARGLRTMVDGPCILLAHWSVTGASTPTGIPTEQFREPVLDANALEAMGWDAIVLGHIHKAQSPLGTADRGGPFFYVGSPMPLNFGETGCEHGVWLLDTDEWSAEFVPIESRPLVTVSVDLTAPIPVHPSQGQMAESSPDGRAFSLSAMEAAYAPKAYPTMRFDELGLDETDALAASLATRLPLTDAVVRLRYKATAEQARRIDLGAIRQLVADAGASKLYSIAAEIVRSERTRVADVDETAGPHEALIRWTEANDIGGQQEEALDSLTARYLEEAQA